MLMSKIEHAVKVLEEHIAEICSVSDWAHLMGFESENYFNRKIRGRFNKSPYQLIVEKKLEIITEKLEGSTDEILFSIALDVGFVDNNALYKFVKRHTGKTPTELRKGRVKRESEKGE